MGLFDRDNGKSTRLKEGQLLLDDANSNHMDASDNCSNRTRASSKKRFGKILFRRRGDREGEERGGGGGKTGGARAQDRLVHHDTIGDALAPEDQFYLEIPNKRKTNRPGGILKRNTKFNNKSRSPRNGDIATVGSRNGSTTTLSLDKSQSTISSLSMGSRKRLNPWSTREAPMLLTPRRRRDPNAVVCPGCCVAGDDNYFDNSIILEKQHTNGSILSGRSARRKPLKHPTFYQWLLSCGQYQPPAAGEDTQNTVETKPDYHQRPENALFDSLDDEEIGSFYETRTTDAVGGGRGGEGGGGGDHTSKKNVWKHIRSMPRGLSRLRSFSKRGRGRKTRGKNDDTVPVVDDSGVETPIAY